MSNSNVLLLFSLSLFFFFNSFASSSFFNATHKCSPQQTLDLLLFKENLSSINHSYNKEDTVDSSCQYFLGYDYHPIMMNWNKNTDCCKWDGIICNHFTGDVIGIDLSCGMLQGTIHPNTTLFHLPHLQTLNLAYNNLTLSQLPRDIGKLSNSLTHLNLSRCGLTGEISEEILFLPSLVSLDLSWNYGLRMQPYILQNLLKNATHLRELLIVNVKVGLVLPPYLNISSPLQSLDLSYTGLQGKLPDNIFDLQYLEKLDLTGNSYLTGQLPKVNTSMNIPLKWLSLSFTNLSGGMHYSFGHLKSLNYLSLISCGLVGSLPRSLVNLRHLTTLYLSNNKFSGTLPSLLFTLPLLEQIYLDSNMFSGGLPSGFYNCRSLKILTLSGNQFDGDIHPGSSPPSFIKLVNLTFLDLNWNKFKGVWDLDALLSSLPNLQALYLSYSGLSIVSNNLPIYVNPDFRSLGLASCKVTLFPESLRGMKNLLHLDLSNNEIHGHIPHWAGEIGGNWLRYLDLSNNSITGLPLFQWDGVEKLYLQSNQIQGPFPRSICNMRNLLDLDISNNCFSGVIPQCLGNISSFLGSLNVKSNQIHGPFPLSICNMSRLSFLDLSNNSFDGVIPQCLGNIISTLGMVDMGSNSFHGTIPNVYEDCVQLEGLILNGNQLEGEIPSSLSKCQYLKVLDLGNNQLTGTFPRWSGDLVKLQVLVLKFNKFHGLIGNYSVNESAFPSLRVLDLSHNRFEGFLPLNYFQNFKAMKIVEKKSIKPEYMRTGPVYYSMVVAMKGVEQKFTQILVDYTIVDLSNNRFEGEIPGVIGSLTSLIVLNLSHNSLTGQIPYVLGNLSEIESLDLSWNQLTGEIPQSLADLTFLGSLNLSENHLEGRIPSGTQFSTFETSFGGNPELCGLPSPKKCERTQETQTEVDRDVDWKSGFTWRVVMIGYGSGTILGLVMVYLMLSTGKPKWFNAIVDANEHMIRTRRNIRRYIFIGK